LKITYGKKWADDFDQLKKNATLALDGWTFATVGTVNNAFEETDGDVLTIGGAPGSVGNDYRTAERSLPGFLTATYTKAMIRYKTEVASSGLGAYAILKYTDATQDVLFPAVTFNTAWTIRGPVALTSGKTASSIVLFADDSPDALDTSTITRVMYDFVMFFKDQIVLPDVTDNVEAIYERLRSEYEVLGRIGEIIIDRGAKAPRMEFKGVLLDGGAINRAGLIKALKEIYTDGVWQWLESDNLNFKADIATIGLTEYTPGYLNETPFRLGTKAFGRIGLTREDFGL